MKVLNFIKCKDLSLRLAVNLIVLIALLVLAHTRPVIGKEVLKIGAIGPLTGPGAAWGIAIYGGAWVAAEEVNRKGGVKVGNNLYEVNIIAYDDKYTGEGGVTAANRLIFEDKVKFIIGPLGSASLLAVQPITEREKVIIFADTYLEEILSPGKPFTFRPVPTTVEYSEDVIGWCSKEYPEKKKVFIVGPDDATGYSLTKHNKKAYEKFGYNIVAVEFYPRGMMDFAPLITKMLARGSEVLELDGGAPTDCGRMIKTAREMGFRGLIVKTGGPGFEEIKAVAGDTIEGFIYWAGCDMKDPKMKPIMESYLKKFPPPVNESMPQWYDGTRIILKAMQIAGTVKDTTAIKNALEGIKEFDGSVGKIHWTGLETYGINHQFKWPSHVFQVKNGQPMLMKKID